MFVVEIIAFGIILALLVNPVYVVLAAAITFLFFRKKK